MKTFLRDSLASNDLSSINCESYVFETRLKCFYLHIVLPSDLKKFPKYSSRFSLLFNNSWVFNKTFDSRKFSFCLNNFSSIIDFFLFDTSGLILFPVLFDMDRGCYKIRNRIIHIYFFYVSSGHFFIRIQYKWTGNVELYIKMKIKWNKGRNFHVIGRKLAYAMLLVSVPFHFIQSYSVCFCFMFNKKKFQSALSSISYII